ncbi:uncharacterized protein LOC101862126 [Aplysia californica]|uniref:Uncharacterized protein LOC101862126 n=1 Tax=Aplysia californica TaxID=6500 RepID=A0ABM0JWF5_APLCA|nr:uncharacterized protein LOC101862126 [Aplysia californica]
MLHIFLLPTEDVEIIPDEMTKSIAEEIHDVLLGDDNTKTDDVFPSNDAQTKQLPFPYPFTLKHVGYLFDKSRHHFTSTSKPPRSRGSSSTSRSTVEDCSSSSRPGLDDSSCPSAKSTPTHVPAKRQQEAKPEVEKKKPGDCSSHLQVL